MLGCLHQGATVNAFPAALVRVRSIDVSRLDHRLAWFRRRGRRRGGDEVLLQRPLESRRPVVTVLHPPGQACKSCVSRFSGSGAVGLGACHDILVGEPAPPPVWLLLLHGVCRAGCALPATAARTRRADSLPSGTVGSFSEVPGSPVSLSRSWWSALHWQYGG